MSNSNERKWVALSSGIKVGIPTAEEKRLTEEVRRNLIPNHRLRREMEQLREQPQPKEQK